MAAKSRAVAGLPPPKEEQTLESDPRTWPTFIRHTLADGQVVPDELVTAQSAAGFIRPPSEFNGVMVLPGAECPTSNHFNAEAGRYHLFVSGVCPWASSVAAARHLLGLSAVITMDVADGQSEAGWVFLSGATCAPWAGRAGHFFAHEVYQASELTCTTRITVPILWDTLTGRVVTNDSWAIIKMMATSFAPLGSPTAAGAAGLYPEDLAEAIEATNVKIHHPLLNGVYRAGIGLLKGAQEAAEIARNEVFESLDALEVLLGGQRFLVGSLLTVIDLRLCMCLLRFDAVYMIAFGLGPDKGGILLGDAYPQLQGYVREVYQMIKPTVRWEAFMQYYRWAGAFEPGLDSSDVNPLPSANGILEKIIQSANAAHTRDIVAAL